MVDESRIAPFLFIATIPRIACKPLISREGDYHFFLDLGFLYLGYPDETLKMR
jgi:hypothetical protein